MQRISRQQSLISHIYIYIHTRIHTYIYIYMYILIYIRSETITSILCFLFNGMGYHPWGHLMSLLVHLGSEIWIPRGANNTSSPLSLSNTWPPESPQPLFSERHIKYFKEPTQMFAAKWVYKWWRFWARTATGHWIPYNFPCNLSNEIVMIHDRFVTTMQHIDNKI